MEIRPCLRYLFLASLQGETRYIFHTEWYDPVSATVNKFHLSFFPRDKSVEMVSIVNRSFLGFTAAMG